MNVEMCPECGAAIYTTDGGRQRHRAWHDAIAVAVSAAVLASGFVDARKVPDDVFEELLTIAKRVQARQK